MEVLTLVILGSQVKSWGGPNMFPTEQRKNCNKERRQSVWLMEDSRKHVPTVVVQKLGHV